MFIKRLSARLSFLVFLFILSVPAQGQSPQGIITGAVEEDISQRLVVSAVYELPFGPGRRFLKGGVLSSVTVGLRLSF